MTGKKLALNIQIPAETDKHLQEMVDQTGFTKTQMVIMLIEFEYKRRKSEESTEKGAQGE